MQLLLYNYTLEPAVPFLNDPDYKTVAKFEKES